MLEHDIENYLRKGTRAHLVGIGGVSMSPLAEVLLGAGLVITGSDITESGVTRRLESLGILIHIGHDASNIGGAELLIRTAAVHDSNPEISAARARGIPVFERAHAWGALMKNYKNAVCISGTHGKTTTTSMATHALMAAGCDPTVMIGGTLPLLHSGYRVGKGDCIVLESCEYYNSFHWFRPTVAVILNIEADHLDFFKDLEEIKASFRKFASLVPPEGFVVANADDANTMDALRGLDRRFLTYSLNGGGDVGARNVVRMGTHSEFDVFYKDSFYAHLKLQVPGTHNIMDALAVSCVAVALGLPGGAVELGLKDFAGAGRRFEYKGAFGGAAVYDDYAHHPGEIKSLLSAVRALGYKRVICVFQPHTYTRTKTLFEDFVRELSEADLVLLADIYAAREKNTAGVSSAELAARIPGAEYLPDFDAIAERLTELASPGDIILTVGAGDICKVGERLVQSVHAKADDGLCRTVKAAQ